ncbi:deoxyguanosinetriphosphate triphosphohydrolase [Candidatus Peregrinibacteria bacterium]|nr:deoxyguanosinetriphosphate triphosphohydrolase [Candidatus Peregrinibacteria bacterium]
MARTKANLEGIEEAALAKYAVYSKDSQGRKYEEKSDDERLDFQRDKDRIIHSRAFRRLDAKTQVFIAGSGDHFRTRLTHTLEVAQISRDIARRLGLNEDLCEAIALAHDLGHPPFGHGGEDALDEVLKEHGLHFEHNEQSRRIVEKLEKVYPNFDGLNLSFEVLDGLMKHQTSWDQSGKEFETFPHLEAQVVNIADEIAYTNHDIDDGLRAGIFSLEDLRSIELWEEAEKMAKEKYRLKMSDRVLSARVVSRLISMMIGDFCQQTEANVAQHNIMTAKDINLFKGKLGDFSEEMMQMITELRGFLYEKLYMNPEVIEFIESGKNMIIQLFNHYMKNPDELPKGFDERDNDDYIHTVKDYIAGMTDSFLQKEFQRLLGKKK